MSAEESTQKYLRMKVNSKTYKRVKQLGLVLDLTKDEDVLDMAVTDLFEKKLPDFQSFTQDIASEFK